MASVMPGNSHHFDKLSYAPVEASFRASPKVYQIRESGEQKGQGLPYPCPAET
jgi:hypothetical protein